jgi:hypothetical protein
VILNALPTDNGELPSNGNYWIRAISSDGCSGFEPGNEPGERQGILRYSDFEPVVPTTTRPDYNTTCQDEPYASLVPIVPWTVPPVPLEELDGMVSITAMHLHSDIYLQVHAALISANRNFRIILCQATNSPGGPLAIPQCG